MIAPSKSSIGSDANELNTTHGPDNLTSYTNRFGRVVEVTSPIVNSNDPLQLRSVWKMFYLDLEEGESRQTDHIAGSWQYFDTEEEAREYVNERIPAPCRWNATITRCRIDQFEREHPVTPNPRTERRQRRVAGLAAMPFEKLQAGHEIALVLLASQEPYILVGEDDFRRRASAFLVRELERAMMAAKMGAGENIEEIEDEMLVVTATKRRKDRSSWKRQLLKADPCCAYCRQQLVSSDATMDHVVPLSMGGPDARDNIVLACERCNVTKYCRTPAQWAHDVLFHQVDSKVNELPRFRGAMLSELTEYLEKMTDSELESTRQMLSQLTANRGQIQGDTLAIAG
ncbi:HNH endonuclease [Lacunimicrobium album]